MMKSTPRTTIHLILFSPMRTRPLLTLRILLSLLVLTALLLALSRTNSQPAVVQASGPFAVNTTVDSVDANPGDGMCADAGSFCSLRAAIQEANALGGTTTISLPLGTYQLTLGELKVGSTSGTVITLFGSGAPANTIIQPVQPGTCPSTPSSCVRVFNLDFNLLGNITVNINHLTIKNGFGSIGGGGGGILGGGPGDVLNLDQVIFDGNTTSADNGGAISYTGGGTLNVQNSIFTNNSSPTGNGGAIQFSMTQVGSLAIANSTFAGNSAGGGALGGQGGAINAGCNLCTPFSITNSSFFQNSAVKNGSSGGQGGALTLGSGNITVQNNQFALNNAAGGGSGIFHGGAATVTATENWWGCNTGPGGAGCDNTSNAAGTLLTNPFLQHMLLPLIGRH
jgi:CSLREA domain-containing protein